MRSVTKSQLILQSKIADGKSQGNPQIANKINHRGSEGTVVVRIGIGQIQKKGLSDCFHIASAATSREEIGNGVYPPAKRKLASVGISCAMHHARQVTKADYDEYDYLLVAERYNIPNLMRQIKNDPNHKVYRLLDFSDHPRDIADPWYTGDFDVTYDDIMEGLEAFLEHLKKEGKI